MTLCPEHWPDRCPSWTVAKTCAVLCLKLERLDQELWVYWRMLEREQQRRINAA